ncbi:MAG: hypothetical protein NVS3B20_06060 [Polyangiales bacterium]
MKPLKQIGIEPLSAARWAKVEQSLFARLDREGLAAEQTQVAISKARKRSLVISLSFAAVFLMVCLSFGAKSFFFKRGGPPIVSRIVTGVHESRLVLGDSAIDVGPESTVLVSGDDERGISVVLDRGQVTCEVAPRGHRPAFIVQAGEARVQVVGTHFVVSRIDDSEAVDVQNGNVEVTFRGVTVPVPAGQSWSSQTPSSATPSPARSSTANVLTLVPFETRQRLLSPKGDEEAPSQEATKILAPFAPAVSAPTRQQLGHNEAASKTIGGDRKRIPAGKDIALSTGAAPIASLATLPSAAILPTPGAAPAPTAQDVYETAAKEEPTNPAHALALYRQVAGMGGPWAANALFAQGRLEAERGHDAEARRLLTEYQSRYPHGRNGADASALLKRLP